MGLFKRGKIVEDTPNNSGLVTVDIQIRRKTRDERQLNVVIVEQDTNKTVFKCNFTDDKSGTDYFAAVKAEEVARTYCDNSNYIMQDVLDNTKDVSVMNNVSKRTR